MAKPRPLSQAAVEWLKSYAAEVEATYSQRFAAEEGRFKDAKVLIKRFSHAVGQVLATDRTAFRAVDEAHNELCIAFALLQNPNPRFSSLEYEPKLEHCEKSIDFRASVDDGGKVYVDVKTIKPGKIDRWDQYERAQKEHWLPKSVEVILSKSWLGGELWHNMFGARSKMLDYALELEQKVIKCKLQHESTRFVLAFCGEGFYWNEDELEDFVEFYFTGRHRPDDPFGNAEGRSLAAKGLAFSKVISRFGCMSRPQGTVDQKRLNWNVQAPKGWHLAL